MTIVLVIIATLMGIGVILLYVMAKVISAGFQALIDLKLMDKR